MASRLQLLILGWVAAMGWATPRTLLAAPCDEVAAVLYVDEDDPGCQVDGGTDAAPFCSLQEALDTDPEPGTAIRVRDSQTPIAGGFTAGHSGLQSAPLVIEPDCGHAPILASGIAINNASHWTVRGLTFEVQDDSVALLFSANTASTLGLIVEDNVFVDSPDGAVDFSGNEEFHNRPIVRRNLLVGVHGTGLSFQDGRDGRIEDNVIIGMECDGADNPSFAAPQEGIRLAEGSANNEIVGNHISDFAPGCTETSPMGSPIRRSVGIRIRSGTVGTLVENNSVQRIPLLDGEGYAGGIQVHDDALDTLVRRNLVTDIEGCGLCDADDFGGSTLNRWEHNTVLGCEVGFAIGGSTNVEIRNNLLEGSRLAVDSSEELGSTIWAGNFYAAPDEAPQFRAAAMNLEFEQWQSTCGCDRTSVAGGPPLSGRPDDFAPTARSGALDIGEPLDEPFVADGPDAGAFEPPVVVETALVLDPLSVVVTLSATPFPPLVPVAGCAGVELMDADDVVRVSECRVTEVGQAWEFVVTLERVNDAAVDATLAVRRPTLVDSSAVGGVFGGFVRPFSVSLAIPPAGGGESTSTGSGEGEGSTQTGGTSGTEATTDASSSSESTTSSSAMGDTDEPGAFPAADLGCGCDTSERQRPRYFGWLLFVLMLARSRARTGRRRRSVRSPPALAPDGRRTSRPSRVAERW